MKLDTNYSSYGYHLLYVISLSSQWSEPTVRILQLCTSYLTWLSKESCMSGYDFCLSNTRTLLQVSILIETVCRFFPAYYNWIYMLTPNYWRFRRACQTVHKFSLEVIQKRRADLEEQKVGHTHSEIQRLGSDFIGLVCSLPVRGREKMCWMEERESTLILLTCYWKQRYVFWTSFAFRLHARDSSRARPNKGDWPLTKSKDSQANRLNGYSEWDSVNLLCSHCCIEILKLNR